MSAVVVRILLRYAAGALVAKGVIGSDATGSILSDPDVIKVAEVALGAGLGLASEAWYYAARRLGWAK